LPTIDYLNNIKEDAVQLVGDKMTTSKMVKTSLIFSLTLNVVFIAGFFYLKHSAQKTIFQMAALNAQAELTTLESIISELNSSDAAKIENLKSRLQQQAETVKKVASVWEGASNGKYKVQQ
jgi:hypothetical protein